MTEPALPNGRGVRGVRALALPTVADARGALLFGQYAEHLPFVPRRFFVLYAVPAGQTRGAHAHRHCQQVLVCLAGACVVTADDGRRQAEFALAAPGQALHLGPLVWSTQQQFSPEGVLLVLASDIYRDDDYIRDYAEFLRAARADER